jgi:hypothetical protein
VPCGLGHPARFWIGSRLVVINHPVSTYTVDGLP